MSSLVTLVKKKKKATTPWFKRSHFQSCRRKRRTSSSGPTLLIYLKKTRTVYSDTADPSGHARTPASARFLSFRQRRSRLCSSSQLSGSLTETESCWIHIDEANGATEDRKERVTPPSTRGQQRAEECRGAGSLPLRRVNAAGVIWDVWFRGGQHSSGGWKLRLQSMALGLRG